MTSHRVAGVDEIAEGSLLRVEVDGTPICLAHLRDGAFAAIDDICTHEEQSLSDGDLEGCHVECPAHGSRFDLRTGQASGFPAEEPTTIYRVTVHGGDVLVEIP